MACTLDVQSKLELDTASRNVVDRDQGCVASVHIGRWWRVAHHLRETFWGQAPEG